MPAESCCRAGTIVNIGKAAGDSVAEDEVIAQIETDKVTIDVRAPHAGTVTRILVRPSSLSIPTCFLPSTHSTARSAPTLECSPFFTIDRQQMPPKGLGDAPWAAECRQSVGRRGEHLDANPTVPPGCEPMQLQLHVAGVGRAERGGGAGHCAAGLRRWVASPLRRSYRLGSQD